tara:strand:+ start:1040 stop:1504 length:465 start_codon:yes stop_codon:yes gene_type:complete
MMNWKIINEILCYQNYLDWLEEVIDIEKNCDKLSESDKEYMIRRQSREINSLPINKENLFNHEKELNYVKDLIKSYGRSQLRKKHKAGEFRREYQEKDSEEYVFIGYAHAIEPCSLYNQGIDCMCLEAKGDREVWISQKEFSEIYENERPYSYH